ncbi:MAG: hypothetical protein ACK5IJ_01690 [Mangrovibacterium sp.]
MLKNINILIVAVLMCLCACEQNITNVYEKTYTLELSRDTVVFNVGGGRKSVEIKTSQEWWEYTETENETWYSVQDFHDADGYDMLTISTDSCTELSNRETVLTINAGDQYTAQLHIIQLGNEPYIHMNLDSITLDCDTMVLNLKYVSNIDFDIENVPNWITMEKQRLLEEDVLNLSIWKNKTGEERIAEIILKQTDGDYQKTLWIKQLAELSEYNPIDVGNAAGNLQIDILSGTFVGSTTSGDFNNTFDGDLTTSAVITKPDTENCQFNYTIDCKGYPLDYMVFYPSTGGSAMLISAIKGRKAGTDEFVSLKGMVSLSATAATTIVPTEIHDDLEEIQIQFMSSGAYYRTIYCAEIGLYTRAMRYDNIFTDKTYSALLPDVTMTEILNIDDVFYRNIAKHLYNGTYQAERILDLEAIQQERTTSKINGASLYEYATGIYFAAGEEVMVFCGDFSGTAPALTVLNESGTSAYTLSAGANKFTIAQGGKVYVNNPTAVKVHIAAGTLEGKFTIDELSSLSNVENETSDVIDIFGDEVHVITPLAFAQTNAPLWNTFNEKVGQIIDAAKVFYGVNEGTYKVESKLGFYIAPEGGSLSTLVNLNAAELNAVCNFDGTYNADVFSVFEKVGNAYEPYLNKLWGIEGVTSKLFALTYFYENKGTSIVKNNDYYALAVQDIIVNNITYAKTTSEWSRVVPLWQLYHYLKNDSGIDDYYAQMCNKEKAKTTVGTYTSEILTYTNQITGANFNDFFYKWNMGGSVSATPTTGGLAYYNEDNLSVYQEMGTLVPGKFYTSLKMLLSYKNMVAIEFYNAGFLAHVALYKSGTSYSVSWDKYSTNMKVKVVGPSGESAEPAYY